MYGKHWALLMKFVFAHDFPNNIPTIEEISEKLKTFWNKSCINLDVLKQFCLSEEE